MKFKRLPAMGKTINRAALSALLVLFLSIPTSLAGNYSLSGNPIWDELLKNCKNSSSGYLCVQNNLFSYVDNVLLNTEFFVSDSFYFKNKVNASSSHYQVPQYSNQIPYPSENVNEESLQFNNFINELESVEQRLDDEENRKDGKDNSVNSRRTNAHSERHSSDVQMSQTGSEQSTSQANDVNIAIKNENDEKTNTNDWEGVGYESPKPSPGTGIWSIDLDQVVNLKPEWNSNNGQVESPSDSTQLNEETNQERWIPKKTSNSIESESKKKLSSRVRHGKSLDVIAETVNQISSSSSPAKESSTQKSNEQAQTSGHNTPQDATTSNRPTKQEIEENMIPDSEHMPEAPYKTIYDVSSMFYEKSVNYFMNHDLVFFLPQFMFGGAQITLSPKGIESDGGINLRLNINSMAKTEDDGKNPNGQSRLFFKHLFKHKKHMFKHKLMSSLLALMMLIKMIKMKLWFVLPLLIGVGAAKKVLLKVLLFIFPALAHLFKLCSYYHHHATRLHLHHHKIKHHHHHVSVPVPIPPPYDPHHHDSHTSSYLDHPPHSSSYLDHPPHSSYHSPHSSSGGHGGIVETGIELDHPPPGYDVYGAGGGHSEYYPSRNDQVGNKLSQHGSIFDSWGLNDIFPTESPGVLPAAAQAYSGYVDDSISALNKMAATNKLHQQQQSALAAQSSVDSNNYNAYLSKLARLQALKQRNYQSAAATALAPTVATSSLAAANMLTSKYNSATLFQNVISPKPPPGVIPVQSAPVVLQSPSSGEYDAFFSPILGKVDQIFTNLGVYDEPCRERLVCNMYRTPNKYSPHSNLVSNELSRDPSELPKSSKPSAPAIRYYKYVQAARDGQDNNECAKLYPTCANKSL